MKVRKIAALAAAAGATALVTACGPSVDPCSTITRPSDAAVQAAREGVEVEAEVDGYECVVDPATGRYVNTGADS